MCYWCYIHTKVSTKICVFIAVKEMWESIFNVSIVHRFSKQNASLRFGSYVYGPVAMRLFYHYNKPDIAFEVHDYQLIEWILLLNGYNFSVLKIQF